VAAAVRLLDVDRCRSASHIHAIVPPSQIIVPPQVPIVLMHMRGTPATMTTLAHYGPPTNPSDEAADGSDVLPAVRAALAQRAAVALAAGVPRWHVVLDPGLGFAKQAAHNFVLLRHGGRLDGPAGKPAPSSGNSAPASSGAAGATSDDAAAGFGLAGYPLLYGPSRKRFLATVLSKSAAAAEEPAPKARVWATAAALTASIAVGAEFVRVHDVAEMRDVVDAADAIYRGAGVPALKA
jgi:dihydropteroate synthase